MQFGGGNSSSNNVYSSSLRSMFVPRRQQALTSEEEVNISSNLSTLPRTTLGHPPPSNTTNIRVTPVVRVNPLGTNNNNSASADNYYGNNSSSSSLPRSTSVRPPPPMMSPQLARLTRTLRRNFDPDFVGGSPISYASSSRDESYQNVNTEMSDCPGEEEDSVYYYDNASHVYCEIQPRRPQQPGPPGARMLFDDDLASDLQNVSDLSEDDEAVLRPSMTSAARSSRARKLMRVAEIRRQIEQAQKEQEEDPGGKVTII